MENKYDYKTIFEELREAVASAKNIIIATEYMANHKIIAVHKYSDVAHGEYGSEEYAEFNCAEMKDDRTEMERLVSFFGGKFVVVGFDPKCTVVRTIINLCRVNGSRIELDNIIDLREFSSEDEKRNCRDLSEYAKCMDPLHKSDYSFSSAKEKMGLLKACFEYTLHCCHITLRQKAANDVCRKAVEIEDEDIAPVKANVKKTIEDYPVGLSVFRFFHSPKPENSVHFWVCGILKSEDTIFRIIANRFILSHGKVLKEDRHFRRFTSKPDVMPSDRLIQYSGVKATDLNVSNDIEKLFQNFYKAAEQLTVFVISRENRNDLEALYRRFGCEPPSVFDIESVFDEISGTSGFDINDIALRYRVCEADGIKNLEEEALAGSKLLQIALGLYEDKFAELSNKKSGVR